MIIGRSRELRFFAPVINIEAVKTGSNSFFDDAGLGVHQVMRWNETNGQLHDEYAE